MKWDIDIHCCHNCWVFKIVRRQKTWYRNCWIVMNEKQQEIFLSCIVSRFLGGMQNAWASCLVLSPSCFAIVELLFWRIPCCSSCCGDLSLCRSCCCSRCGDMSDCYIIQTGESSSGTCCCWNPRGSLLKEVPITKYRHNPRLATSPKDTRYRVLRQSRIHHRHTTHNKHPRILAQ